MARFLLAIVDGGGTVPPALAVAAELIRRGHAVTALADPTVAGSARAAGCAFRPWRAAPHFPTLEEQTAFLTTVEGGNPVRAHRIARDRLICGGAPGYAADNTVRALRPGAGMRVGKSASAEELAAGVRQVLQEPEYARAARRFAADRAEALLGR